MYVQSSLWNATKWRGPPNWSHGPFIANFREFEIFGCPFDKSNPAKCDSPQFGWNAPNNWQLTPQQQGVYTKFKHDHIDYDYCKAADRRKYPECNDP